MHNSSLDFSLDLSRTVSRTATKPGKQSFLQLLYSLTPSWRGTETGGTMQGSEAVVMQSRNTKFLI